jgi:transcriptional/translational regulatory protein YebC/TACO1
MFAKKGEILVEIKKEEKDALFLAAVDSGALDIQELLPTQFLVYTEANDVEKISEFLRKANFSILSANLSLVASNEVKISDSKMADTLIKLIEGLEDLDDVSEVVANFNIDDELLK